MQLGSFFQLPEAGITGKTNLKTHEVEQGIEGKQFFFFMFTVARVLSILYIYSMYIFLYLLSG